VKFWIASKVELQSWPKPKVFSEDPIQCEKCGSIRVVKYGHSYGKQVFKCRDCGKKFREGSSPLIQYARRHRAKRRVILFVDHAPCHKTKNVKRFIRAHPILRVKRLPKRAPNLNPVERLVNKPLKSAVCTNRSYSRIDDVIKAGRRFLTKYKQTLGT
jgi:transposase-like protein